MSFLVPSRFAFQTQLRLHLVVKLCTIRHSGYHSAISLVGDTYRHAEPAIAWHAGGQLISVQMGTCTAGQLCPQQNKRQ